MKLFNFFWCFIYSVYVPISIPFFSVKLVKPIINMCVFVTKNNYFAKKMKHKEKVLKIDIIRTLTFMNAFLCLLFLECNY